MTLTEILKEKQALQAQYKAKCEEFKAFEITCKQELAKLEKLETLSKGNLDTEKFLMGEKLLMLEFPSKKQIYSPIYKDIVNDAMNDIANGCPELSKVYFGQKYYSGYDQRADCRYGYCPSYGSIYQRIGLKNPDKPLTSEETEACLYFLANIDTKVKILNKEIRLEPPKKNKGNIERE